MLGRADVRLALNCYHLLRREQYGQLPSRPWDGQRSRMANVVTVVQVGRPCRPTDTRHIPAQTSAATRKPVLPVELSGVFALRAATR